jgi:TIR domain
MTDIFFSYSREDKDRVAFIAAALEAEGYDLWWDTDIAPGETYRGVMQRKLREAKCVIVVWSKNSADSRWVFGKAEEYFVSEGR